MRVLRSYLGACLLVVGLTIGVALGATAFQIHQQTQPRRSPDAPLDFDAMRIRVEALRFDASDGLSLSAWLLRGVPGRPAVILCHDLGSNKSSLVNQAIALRKEGFHVFLFDFRGHGESPGGPSTLGLKEKRDVIGAVDFLARQPDVDARHLGIYGVGMGAHAAVLAAADRPQLRVLVLDALYPDVEYPLVRRVYAGWSFGVRNLSFLPRGVFALMSGADASSQRAADVVQRLVGRDLLLLAPAGDTALAAEMQRMYETLPEAQADTDGNLVVMPSTLGQGLYGEQLARYSERVTAFFGNRLARQSERG